MAYRLAEESFVSILFTPSEGNAKGIADSGDCL